MKTSRFFPLLFFTHLMSKTDPNDFNIPKYRGMAIGGYNPIYIPRNGKFKGYMRENRKCKFNKNK